MEIDSSIVETLCKKLNEDRKKETLSSVETLCKKLNEGGCDLILVSNDEKRFPVHKNVLSTYSYFHNSSKCEKININISAKQLEIVINYLYTGEINVTEVSEAKALYETAQVLNLPFLQKYSTNKLIKSVTLTFLLEYWSHAVKYSIQNLKTECLKLIGDNVEEFFDNNLQYLTDEEFLQIIENREVLGVSVIEFYKIIKKWIIMDYDKRKWYIDKILLQIIDYNKIDSSILLQEIEFFSKLECNTGIIKKMTSTLKNQNQNPDTTKDIVPKSSAGHKPAEISFNLQTSASTIYTATTPSTTVASITCSDISFNDKKTTEYVNSSAEILSISSTENVAIFAPENLSNAVSENLQISSTESDKTFSAEKLENCYADTMAVYSAWNDSTVMNENSPYVINKQLLQIFKISMNKFLLEYNSSDNRILDYSTCGIKYGNHKSILLSGGIIHETRNLQKRNVIWTPNSGELINLPTLLIARYRHGVIFANNKIYACGGNVVTYGRPQTNSTEILDLQNETWMKGPEFVNHKANFGITSLNDNIYAFGNTAGYNAGYVNYFMTQPERLDPRDRENKWFLIHTNSDFTFNKCIPLSDYTILCFGLKNNNLTGARFDTRNSKFENNCGTLKTISIKCSYYDIFKFENDIYYSYKDLYSPFLNILKYQNNAVWYDDRIIKYKTDVNNFDIINF